MLFVALNMRVNSFKCKSCERYKHVFMRLLVCEDICRVCSRKHEVMLAWLWVCCRGKLLGTKGSMLKQLMQEAG